jgi:hypothetical protein
MIYRRNLIQNKLIKALKTLGWLIRWAIQWFFVLATTAFKIQVAGSYPKNSNSSVRFKALPFLPPILRVYLPGRSLLYSSTTQSVSMFRWI